MRVGTIPVVSHPAAHDAARTQLGAFGGVHPDPLFSKRGHWWTWPLRPNGPSRRLGVVARVTSKKWVIVVYWFDALDGVVADKRACGRRRGVSKPAVERGKIHVLRRRCYCEVV